MLIYRLKRLFRLVSGEAVFDSLGFEQPLAHGLDFCWFQRSEPAFRPPLPDQRPDHFIVPNIGQMGIFFASRSTSPVNLRFAVPRQ